MRELIRGRLSGNGIKNRIVAGDMTTVGGSTAPKHWCGRFALRGEIQVVEGQRYSLVLDDGRAFLVEIDRVSTGPPCVAWFTTV
jgi:hypothetical protein